MQGPGGDIDNGASVRLCTCGSLWDISVPSAQVWGKPKTALKNSLLKKNERTLLKILQIKRIIKEHFGNMPINLIT